VREFAALNGDEGGNGIENDNVPRGVELPLSRRWGPLKIRTGYLRYASNVGVVHSQVIKNRYTPTPGPAEARVKCPPWFPRVHDPFVEIRFLLLWSQHRTMPDVRIGAACRVVASQLHVTCGFFFHFGAPAVLVQKSHIRRRSIFIDSSSRARVT
jgi:hypothetical protein